MNFSPKPRRSVLYMPGSNARALEKAKSLEADCLILDLEDAVAPEAKAMARVQVCDAVRDGGYGSREIIIRVNAKETEWHEDDIAAVLKCTPDAILLPKVNHGGDIAALDQLITQARPDAEIGLWAMMETPLAMLNAAAIAAAKKDHPRFSCFVMGTNDLAKETRAGLGQERLAMIPWLTTCVAAARAHGLDVIDGVYNDFRNDAGLHSEASQGRLLGMDGKTLIHPGQLKTTNEVFSPAPEEVLTARAIIDAFNQPENAGKGAINLDGRMVELLHRDVAQRTLNIQDAITAKQVSD